MSSAVPPTVPPTLPPTVPPTVPSTVLSLSPLTILDTPPPEQVGAAAAAGFDAVGIRVAPAADERVWPMLGDTPVLRETLARMAGTGVQVLDVELVMLRPDLDRDAVRAVLDAGHRLGARFVLTLGYDPDEARLTDHFAWLCEQAADRGLRPGLEFMKYCPVPTLAAAVRIVRGAGHPAGAVLVDALHLRRSGGSPADLAGVAADLLPYGQLCDGPLDPVWPDDEQARIESRTARLLPGDGEFPLAALVRALPAGGALSVEAPVAALVGLDATERAHRARAAADRVLAGVDPGAAR